MSVPSTSSTSSRTVMGPVDLPSGRKQYLVTGHPFEVPPRYAVSKSIGFGAYGVVCAVTDLKFQPPADAPDRKRKVAVKKCKDIFKDVGDCKRILREIKLLKFLKHENLLGLQSCYLGGNDPRVFQDVYIVTDLLDTDLNTILKSKQKISEEHLKYFIYQVLRGLKYLHSARVMHRDLKPANLLVNVNCDLRICDFGLARGFETAEEKDALLTDYVVTRWYRPPELLLMNKHYSAAVDIWSTGCIFAEILNRRPLFAGRDYLTQLRLICDTIGTPKSDQLGFLENKEAINYVTSLPPKDPIPLPTLFPALGEEGIDFVNRMLQYNPNHRCSADDLMAHPYMGPLHDPTDEPSAEGFFKWEYDGHDKITKDQLRALFAEEASPWTDDTA